MYTSQLYQNTEFLLNAPCTVYFSHTEIPEVVLEKKLQTTVLQHS